MSGATGLLGIGSLGAIAVAGRGVLNFERGLTRLQISSGKTRGEILALKDSIFKGGKTLGVDPDAFLGGAQKFTEMTGNLDGFIASMTDLGKVSKATGSDMESIAATSAALATNMNIAGEDFGRAFDVLVSQGKAGAVELKDLAGLLPGITPLFSQFGDQGVEGLAELGAFLQITKEGFGSAQEAATGMSALMGAIIKNSKKLKGVKVFEKVGGVKKLRSLKDIVFEIGESKLAKDPGKLLKALGRKEAYSALIKILDKGRGSFDSLSDSTKAAGTVQKDFQTFMDSTAGRIDVAQAKLKQAFNKALVDNIESIAKAVSGLAKAIGFLADAPLTALGIFGALKFGPGLIAGAAGLRAGTGVAAIAGGTAKAGVAGGLLAKLGSVLSSPAGLIAAAGAGGVAIGTFADKMLGLSDRISDVLAFGEVRDTDVRTKADVLETAAKVKDPLDPLGAAALLSNEAHSFPVGHPRRKQLLNQALGIRDRNRKAVNRVEQDRAFLESVGVDVPVKGDIGVHPQRIVELRKAQAIASKFGVTKSEIRRAGPEALLKQFPTTLAASGRETLDAAGRERAVSQAEEGRVLRRDPRVPLAEAPLALGRSKLEVVIRFAEDQRPVAEVVSNSREQRRSR